MTSKIFNVSNLSNQEANILYQLVQECKEDLDDDDKATAECISTKLEKAHDILSSGATSLTFANRRLHLFPLSFISDKTEELVALGLTKGPGDNSLAIGTTKELISLIRTLVSFSTEAGCSVLVNAILLHVISNMRNSQTAAGIIPEFQINEPKVEQATGLYGGVINYLIIYGSPIYIKFILDGPHLAFCTPDTVVKNVSCSIYQTMKESVIEAAPQAAMASVEYCQQHNFKTYRGCVTNGKSWVFFVFNSNPSSVGGAVSMSREFSIGEDLSGLPLVLGLLRDWIVNSKEKDQLFFNYYKHS